jgi:hypothetical protein
MSKKVKKKINSDTSIENLKIVYLSYIRLTDRVSYTWFIDELLHKGIDVEYWDLIPFMRENHREVNEINPEFLKELNSLIELEINIKKQVKDVVYVILFPLDNSTKNVFLKLSKLKVKIVYIDWGAMPINMKNEQASIVKRAVGTFRSLNYLKLVIQSKKIFMLQKFGLIKKFDIVFASGSILENKPRHAQRVVPFPFTDYIQYKKTKNYPKINMPRFAVFLDVNLPFQSDLTLGGLPKINPKMYYSELDTFFRIIEATFNVDIVIAAHPKSLPNSNNFGNRTMMRMKTAELVRDAEFVISHHSTSISYAVLNYKPIMFIYTETMKTLYTKNVIADIKNIADYFGLEPLTVNRSPDLVLISLNQVNKRNYDEYIENYIASKNSRQLLPTEVFISEIINLSKSREV